MIAEIGSVLSVANKAIDLLINNDADELAKRGQLAWDTKGSMTKLIAETMIAPRVIISESLKTNSDIDKIVNFNIDIITGMICKTFILLTDLKGLSPNTAFDVLKTKKENTFGLESLLPFENQNLHMAMLSSKGLTFGKNMVAKLEAERPVKKDDVSALYSKDIDLKLEVKTKDGSTKSIILPIIVKANISFNSIVRIKEDLIDKNFEKDYTERIAEARAGMISWKNFWIPLDMVKAYREKKIKDVDSLLSYAEERGRMSASQIANSGMPSLSTYLGSLVITFNDLEDIENNVLRGPIQKDKQRNMLFENSKVCLLNIVDTDYEKLTIVTKDIDGQSIMDIKSLKKNTNGNDVNDLFKDLLMNRRF